MCCLFDNIKNQSSSLSHNQPTHTHTRQSHMSSTSFAFYKNSLCCYLNIMTNAESKEREGLCERDDEKERVGESERDKERVANSLLSHNSFGLWKQIQFGSCLWKCLCKTCANCRSVCVCVCVVLSRPEEEGGKAKLKLAGKLMSHDRDRQRVSELASASCCGRGCNAF